MHVTSTVQSIRLSCHCVLIVLLSIPTSQAAVSVMLSDVRVARDGSGLVKIVAVDELPNFPEAVTSFRLELQIKDVLDDSRLVRFFDEASIAEARQDDDYVFAGKDIFLSEQEISADGLTLTITDALNFTESPSSFAVRQTLGTFRVGLTSGDPLTPDDQFSIFLTDRTVLFGAAGTQIEAGNVQFAHGPVVVTAVPEPGGTLLCFAVAGCVGYRRRRVRAAKRFVRR